MHLRPLVAVTAFGLTAWVACAADGAAPERPKQDARGNPLRYAKSGHVSNYDEAKVGTYTLPDPLQLRSGERVRDADGWMKQRRPEIVALYEKEIFGRVPATAPKVTFEVVENGTRVLDGAAVRKHVVLRFGEGEEAVKANLVIYFPAAARAPVPALLQLVFFGGLPMANPPGAVTSPTPPGAPGAPAAPGAPPATKAPRPSEASAAAEIIGRGYAYATLRYTEIEGDRADTNLTGVRKLALAAGQEKPAAEEWGTIAAWAWGVSRVMDYFATDRAIDAARVGLIGHSRLGKTVLWAGAKEPRIAVVFSSCSGEMGAALARRDYGESVDDMAANFPWQFAGNFQNYVARWNEMPVDAHLLIALNAPRPVFVTGGTQDQWADPHGMFLAQVAAGPVYRLLGKQDLGAETLPPLDKPLVSGDLGFLYHTGGHTIMPGDWQAFLGFAERTLRPGKE